MGCRYKIHDLYPYLWLPIPVTPMDYQTHAIAYLFLGGGGCWFILHIDFSLLHCLHGQTCHWLISPIDHYYNIYDGLIWACSSEIWLWKAVIASRDPAGLRNRCTCQLSPSEDLLSSIIWQFFLFQLSVPYIVVISCSFHDHLFYYLMRQISRKTRKQW